MKPPPQINGLVEQVKKFAEAKSSGQASHGVNINDIDSMTIKRQIPVQRGKWRILPPGIEDLGKDS